MVGEKEERGIGKERSERRGRGMREAKDKREMPEMGTAENVEGERERDPHRSETRADRSDEATKLNNKIIEEMRGERAQDENRQI